jgi:predicted nucleic acid-binding protein
VNVVFSGLYSSRGAPARIIDLHVEGQITIVISQVVLEEVVATLTAKQPGLLPALLDLLTSAPPEIVADLTDAEVARWQAVIHDPDDAPILAAAVAALPDVFVTGNTKHYLDNPEVARISGLRIVTPAQFMAS